jgi:hypothetical protein
LQSALWRTWRHNSTLHAGEICSFPLHISRVALLLLRQRRGRGNDLGTTIKYLRKTTSGAAGNYLSTKIKFPRRTTGAASGNGLGTRLNYLRVTPGRNGQMPSTLNERRRGKRPGHHGK